MRERPQAWWSDRDVKPSDFRFRPSLIDAVKGYGRADFTADLGAGLTVACVAMPLAMAFGIASDVKPEQGLITAVVGGFIVSLLGGSRVQIGGPAGAFVALLYAIADRYGIANLLISTMMAGVLLMAMGFFKLGQMVRSAGFAAECSVAISRSRTRLKCRQGSPKRPQEGPPWVFQSSFRLMRLIRLLVWSKCALKNIVFCMSPS